VPALGREGLITSKQSYISVIARVATRSPSCASLRTTMLSALDAIGTDTVAVLSRALSTLGAGRTALRKHNLTDEQRRHADAILGAYDRQDAAEAIDEWITEVAETLQFAPSDGGPSWGRSTENAAADLETAADEPLKLDSLRRVLGDGPVRVCEEGQEALVSLLRLLAALVRNRKALKSSHEADGSPTTTERNPSTARDLLYSDAMPLPIRRGFAGIARSFAASFAIARAEERVERLEPWLAMYLAETFRDGFRQVASAIDRFVAGQLDFEPIRATEAARRKLLDEWWAEPTEQQAAAD